MKLDLDVLATAYVVFVFDNARAPDPDELADIADDFINEMFDSESSVDILDPKVFTELKKMASYLIWNDMRFNKLIFTNHPII